MPRFFPEPSCPEFGTASEAERGFLPGRGSPSVGTPRETTGEVETADGGGGAGTLGDGPNVG